MSAGDRAPLGAYDGPRTPLLGGGAVSLLTPQPDMICLDAVALGLSRQRRWLGQTRRPLSVLEHSCAVALASPRRLMLPALLHDAHEHALGDMTRAVQAALASRLPVTFPIAWARLRAEMDGAVAHAVMASVGSVIGARALAAAMMDPELMRLDAAIGEHERAVLMDASESFGLDRVWLHYTVEEPDEVALMAAWLKAVRLLAAEWPGCGPMTAEAATGVLRRAMGLW